MSTFTNSSFATYQAEDFNALGGFVDQGTQTWTVEGSNLGFAGSGYIQANGNDNANPSELFLPVNAPNANQNVWIRCRGNAQFQVTLANDPTADTLNAPIDWDWVLLPTQIAFQSQIQFITLQDGAQVDAVIISDAPETPTGSEGFTNNQNPPSGGNNNANTDDGICAGTETVACFHCYEAESAFWLEPGSGTAKWLLDNSSGSGASQDSFIKSNENTPANDFAAAGKAHITITPTQIPGWSTWFRVRGSGTFLHSWADDAGVTPIAINETEWAWVKSTAPENPNASKIRLTTQDDGVEIDKIAQIDSDEVPTDTDGFCQTNGSGGSNNGEGNEITINVEQNDDRYLYLPENLSCRLTVIPPEITNR